MKMRVSPRDAVGAVLLISLALAGCSPTGADDSVCEQPDGDGAGAAGREGFPVNGRHLQGISSFEMQNQGLSLNGMTMQGTSFNGVQLQGASLNGISMQGISLQGANLNGVALNGSELIGVTPDGRPVSGTELVGATLTGTLSTGEALPLRIDSAETLTQPNQDVWGYAVSYQTREGWRPLCGTSGSATVLAIPLTGVWNYESGVVGGGAWSESSTTFTLGCRGAGLAKCVELGYKPWKTVGGALLRDHHQACTRMLRADYCGDGTGWTRDGTLINVYDNLGIQSDEAGWNIDAEWTPEGALCADSIRDFQQGTPACLDRLEQNDCGGFSSGALLIDEYRAACEAE
jgi:hypothetical protein